MAYTRVNWVDSPSTSTPISAADLNTMDSYIATLDTGVAWKASANIFSAAQEIDLALSGATKVFLTLKATDGNTWALQITTGGALQLTCNGTVMVEWSATQGTIYAGPSSASPASKVWHLNNDGAGSGLDADTIGGRVIRVSTSDPGLGTGGAWIKDA